MCPALPLLFRYEVEARLVLNELQALRESDPRRVRVSGPDGTGTTTKKTWLLSETAAGAVDSVNEAIAALVRDQEANEARARERAEEEDDYF